MAATAGMKPYSSTAHCQEPGDGLVPVGAAGSVTSGLVSDLFTRNKYI